jgi:hypothetical protein
VNAHRMATAASALIIVAALGLWLVVLATMQPDVAQPAPSNCPQTAPSPTTQPGPPVPSGSSIGDAWSWTESGR